MLDLTTNLLVDIGGWPAMKEARVLVERGRVREARREGNIIRAEVQGAEKTHQPQIILADRIANVEVRCTCAESRKTGRVCPHALAAGLALLQPKVAAAVPSGGQASTKLATSSKRASAEIKKRFLIEDAPPGTPIIELTALLPLQLKEALAKDPIRIILEAKRETDAQPLPFDSIAPSLSTVYAVSDGDEQVLHTLESFTGSASGINAIPRTKIGAFLHALGNHPRVWLGKKQRVAVHASAERLQIIVSRTDDGALELSFGSRRTLGDGRGDDRDHAKGGEKNQAFASLHPQSMSRESTSPPPGVRRLPTKIELVPNWTFDGATLTESPALPAGFSSSTRIIPSAQIPDFLTREWPALERTCDLVFAPGFEEFRLEIGQPEFEVRLDGALSGLTLDLIARYGGEEFSLNGKTESTAYQRYFPAKFSEHHGLTTAATFWRRNVLAERKALAEIDAAGFSHVRSGAAAYSLISENHVARFLANMLPRWRREWTVTFGPRLEATMEQVDIAQPEFSLKSSSGEDWLSLDLKLSVGGKPIALDQSEIQRWLQTGQNHARTAGKRVLLVPTEAWSEMKEVLADCEVEQEPGQIRVGRTFAPYLSGALTAQGFHDIQPGHALTSAAAIDFKSAFDPKLREQLRPYQTHGVEWLAGLAQQNLPGLLADDMGLGKTLQALAFCAWLKSSSGGSASGLTLTDSDSRQKQPRKNARVDPSSSDVAEPIRVRPEADPPRNEPALIVCPTSLVTNWLREAARFTPHLRALDLTGSNRAEKFAAKNDYDLLVTSYAILRRDIEHYRVTEFSLVVLDEAQHIKNRASQNAQSAKALRARHRLILTGTPLENSVLDLWSLFDFLLPGYLGTAAEFKERYETPLTQQPQPKLMERLRHRVRPFFLRRTKEEVLTELPPKLEFPTLIELTDEQREVYRAVLAQGRREVFDNSDKAGRKSGRDRLAVLTTLLRLRQVCCHLDLLPTAQGGPDNSLSGWSRSSGATGGRPSVSDSPLSERERFSATSRSLREPGQQVVRATQQTPITRWSQPSAKLDRTFELIDEAIDGGHRVLLFSQFVRVLHLLRDEATKREIKFCYLDGQTVERQAEVDRFQNDSGIPLFFISLKAGGTGLNLTGADTVIHFDPWWNPAVEEQATSRAHRMGQARSVSAYKLIAAGTVEEKIQALQARKRELFEASLGGDEAFVEKLSGDDLEELLAE